MSQCSLHEVSCWFHVLFWWTGSLFAFRRPPVNQSVWVWSFPPSLTSSEASSILNQKQKRRVCAAVSHHGEHAEAGLTQQVAQVGDGRVGGDVGGESALPLRLGKLKGATQLVQGFPAHHRPDEHPVWLQHLVDLSGGGKTMSFVSFCSKESQKHPFNVCCSFTVWGEQKLCRRQRTRRTFYHHK